MPHGLQCHTLRNKSIRTKHKLQFRNCLLIFRKNLLLEFCDFCNQDFYKILKFHSVRWLGLATCIERTLKLYPSLKSYFLSENPKIKNREKATSRLNRFIDAFGNIMTEVGIFAVDIFHLWSHGLFLT